MHMPHFAYPFIHLWTYGLFLPLGYCELCCDESGDTNDCSSLFQFVWGVPRNGIAGLYGHSMFNFFEEAAFVLIFIFKIVHENITYLDYKNFQDLLQPWKIVHAARGVHPWHCAERSHTALFQNHEQTP